MSSETNRKTAIALTRVLTDHGADERPIALSNEQLGNILGLHVATIKRGLATAAGRGWIERRYVQSDPTLPTGRLLAVTAKPNVQDDEVVVEDAA